MYDSGLSVKKHFHDKIIKAIRVIRNDPAFNDTNWKRIAITSEGNTNVESVGEFSVRFCFIF